MGRQSVRAHPEARRAVTAAAAFDSLIRNGKGIRYRTILLSTIVFTHVCFISLCSNVYQQRCLLSTSGAFGACNTTSSPFSTPNLPNSHLSPFHHQHHRVHSRPMLRPRTRAPPHRIQRLSQRRIADQPRSRNQVFHVWSSVQLSSKLYQAP